MSHNLRDISSFSKEETDAFLASFDTVLSDCDGEFHNCCMSYSISIRFNLEFILCYCGLVTPWVVRVISSAL